MVEKLEHEGDSWVESAVFKRLVLVLLPGIHTFHCTPTRRPMVQGRLEARRWYPPLSCPFGEHIFFSRHRHVASQPRDLYFCRTLRGAATLCDRVRTAGRLAQQRCQPICQSKSTDEESEDIASVENSTGSSAGIELFLVGDSELEESSLGITHKPSQVRACQRAWKGVEALVPAPWREAKFDLRDWPCGRAESWATAALCRSFKPQAGATPAHRLIAKEGRIFRQMRLRASEIAFFKQEVPARMMEAGFATVGDEGAMSQVRLDIV